MTFRLYGYWRSSSSWRVRIGLALKGVAYEYAAVNLLEQEQFREEHRARNPTGQVPAFRDHQGMTALARVRWGAEELTLYRLGA